VAHVDLTGGERPGRRGGVRRLVRVGVRGRTVTRRRCGRQRAPEEGELDPEPAAVLRLQIGRDVPPLGPEVGVGAVVRGEDEGARLQRPGVPGRVGTAHGLRQVQGCLDLLPGSLPAPGGGQPQRQSGKGEGRGAATGRPALHPTHRAARRPEHPGPPPAAPYSSRSASAGEVRLIRQAGDQPGEEGTPGRPGVRPAGRAPGPPPSGGSSRRSGGSPRRS
jgi:hypothetical protein